jgi:hypothetical protein
LNKRSKGDKKFTSGQGESDGMESKVGYEYLLGGDLIEKLLDFCCSRLV